MERERGITAQQSVLSVRCICIFTGGSYCSTKDIVLPTDLCSHAVETEKNSERETRSWEREERKFECGESECMCVCSIGGKTRETF